ncbi:MAG: DUF4865 domain-containing protein [Actinobacteria bacterium 13_2_20CM_2_71_6]|nr:MAG: DUF4865 domain-containing protein [Actinobacteria bacterium 13_2_20CM_2_71_6]
MDAMQYEITLPADYDMDIIRHRIATKGPILDNFPGLGLKAYGIRVRGVDGSPVNQYAPFYLWTAKEAMNTFLWGGGFSGIIESFGRPEVQHWTGIGYAPGPARSAAPRTATKRVELVGAGADPASVIDHGLAEMHGRARMPQAHSTALAIDPRRWELVHFTLWADPPPEPEGLSYQVLHLCSPHLDDIPAGRHW